MCLVESCKYDFSFLQSMTDMNQNQICHTLPSNYEFTLFISCNIYMKFQERGVIMRCGFLKDEKADIV
jgi:hypothetical protein